jgi:dGTPase
LSATLAMTIQEREQFLLAPYAFPSSAEGGRQFPEPPHLFRGPFQRDRDRIVHCGAFRRLSQKTQVFTGHALGDYHRTRLTHTLEGTSIARTIGRALRLNEDLIEALMLMHDLGHPPFGHAGEDALDECLHEQGGFNHNAQALRIVELIESRIAGQPGLNLCRATLDGHTARTKKTRHDLQPMLEAQVVDAADSLTYDAHDPDDALYYGILKSSELMEVPFWQAAAKRVQQAYANLSEVESRRAIVHQLIDWQVTDLVQQTERNLAQVGTPAWSEIPNLPLLVHPSTEMQELKLGLERFLYQRVYRRPELLTSRVELQSQLKALFAYYCQHPELMAARYRDHIPSQGLARCVGDYIAGMTDRFAQQEFTQRLCKTA